MNTDVRDPAAIERRLWDEITRHQIGMLGLVSAKARLQPMTAFPEPEREQIWFFTRNDTELAQEVGEGRPAVFAFQQRDLQACISGQLTLEHDTARIEKYWNAVVAAWNPGGKADPRLTLLRLDCHDAEVWVSEAGPVKFAWEIAKANATKHQPHVGGKASLHFH